LLRKLLLRVLLQVARFVEREESLHDPYVELINSFKKKFYRAWGVGIIAAMLFLVIGGGSLFFKDTVQYDGSASTATATVVPVVKHRGAHKTPAKVHGVVYDELDRLTPSLRENLINLLPSPM